MRSTSGYASIWYIFFHQLQPRDSMAPITRGLPNVQRLCVDDVYQATTVVCIIAPMECYLAAKDIFNKKGVFLWSNP